MFSFKEGASGYGVVQTHEYLDLDMQRWNTDPMGWRALRMDEESMSALTGLIGRDPTPLIEAAQQGSSSDLKAALAPLLKPGRWELLPWADQRVVSHVFPVSVHTDLRLVRNGDDFWEGGEILSPGTQFSPNALLSMSMGEAAEAILDVAPPIGLMKSAIPPHSTATSDGAWDGPANEARLKMGADEAYYKSAFAWMDPAGDPSKKVTYRFPHHEVDADGTVGPANLQACRTGIGVLNGARGGTTIPEVDQPGVRRHLMRHIRDAEKAAKKAVAKDETSDVLRGPLGWVRFGANGCDTIPPGPMEPERWSRFLVRDSFQWKAGVQRPDYREFWISDGIAMNGLWTMTFAPGAEGEVDAWKLTRPAEQKPESAALQPLAAAVAKRLVIKAQILKADTAKRIVIGLIQEPEVADAQGHVISEDEIEEAAHDFLAGYNHDTTVGLMHKSFNRPLELVESWIQREDAQINGHPVRKGSWMAGVHVIDDESWKGVQDGTLTGFSLAGTAAIEPLTPSV